MSAQRRDRTHHMHWLYRCFDAEGRLIYVGSTTDLFGRLKTHRAQAWWAGQVAKVRATVHPNGTVARQLERRAIRDEVPRWNKAHKWEGRNNWARQDWQDWLTIIAQSEGATSRELRRAMVTYASLWEEPAPEYFSRMAAEMDADAEAFRAKWDAENRKVERRLKAVRS